jgi:DNA-binding NarL/FixJ family response regulator
MIRIAIVDDHDVVRIGLRHYFRHDPDLQVTAEAADGREALDIVRRGAADVMLMDLEMPHQGGVDTLAAIKARLPAFPVLVMSGHSASEYAAAVIKRGAAGFLSKTARPDEVVHAVRLAAQGRRYISAEVAELLAEGVAAPAAGAGAAHEELSEREFQVFLRLARGETVGAIAQGMSLSIKTISTYRTRVMEKMGLATNSDLTYYALKRGLID